MPKALEQKLRRQANKNIRKGIMSKARKNAYVYGTLNRIEKAKEKKAA